ncbi:AAA family ATPase [Robbsia sp. KACC 23696]|uniref:AAA family ATPase n=1 Tax=Robbsia sp. KACC 23696 TaxID=3149231 RepID=UPI00325A7C4E
MSPAIPVTVKPSGARVADFVAFVADKETEQVLRRYVLDQALPHVHVAIGSIDEAIAYLAKVERSPLLLMIDLHGSAMPLSDLMRLSEVCEPSVQVVALGERNDVGLYRSLLKIGLRDYLVKPLTVELLTRTFDFSEGRVRDVSSSRTGKIITFTGTRGGVGVTTLAVGLARHLSGRTHRRVVYVDLDLQGGGASSMLGLKSNDGLVDVLENAHRLDPQYVERTLMSNQSRLFMLSAELDINKHPEFAAQSLTRVLELLSNSFHYVLMDAPRTVTPLIEEAFDRSARVYVVTDRTVHSTRQAVRLMKHIEQRDHNPQTSVLVNNPNGAVAGKVDVSDLDAALGRNTLQEFRFEQKSLMIAENLGENPKEAAASQFHHSITTLANDLTGQRTAKSVGWMDKLKGKVKRS